MENPNTTALDNALDRVETRMDEISREHMDTVKAWQKAQEESNDTARKALEQRMQGWASEQFALQETQKQIQKAVSHLEARPKGDGSVMDLRGESLISKVWNSPAYKEFRNAKHRYPKTLEGIELGSLFGISRNQRAIMEAIQMERRAEGDPTHDDSSVGSWVKPWYRPDFIDLPFGMPVMRSILDVIAVSSDTVEIDRELRYSEAAMRLTADVVATATTADLDNVTGLKTTAPFNQVTFDNGTNQETVTISDITGLTITFTPALANGYDAPTDGDPESGALVVSTTVAETPEGALVPLSLLETEAKQIPVGTLSTGAKISLQKMQDIAALEQFLRRRLATRMGRIEDFNIFYNPGTAGKMFTGIFNDTDVDAVKLGALSSFPANTTVIDYLIENYYDLAENHYIPNRAVVSVKTHRLIALTKDSQRRYIYFINDQPGTPPRVHLVEVLMSTNLNPNDAMMADFSDTMTLYDRQQSMIDVGTEDDDLRRLRRTMIISERIALGIERPAGVRKMEVDSLP
jgi:HK97 family phage major capsid protein